MMVAVMIMISLTVMMVSVVMTMGPLCYTTVTPLEHHCDTTVTAL
jgi:hypothetical protein